MVEGTNEFNAYVKMRLPWVAVLLIRILHNNFYKVFFSSSFVLLKSRISV